MPLKKRVDLSGIRSADFKASGMNRPHSKAEYMPAPDQPVINVRKPLPHGGCPYMHCLLGSETGKAALGDLDLGADCVRHARMFFDLPDYDLASAVPGSFAIAPAPKMVDALTRDYANTAAMIFGTPPSFDDILESARQIEQDINTHS
ncbi:hypothetical protein [Mesorhizobium sp.]|uniref:hypothetical protein n=2 Tax=Mesorhizobium sp. TaxID=1871066 RepID=UPI0025E2EF94|nr:hypothetical protein [Mesorhizobium sp.]